MFEWPEWLMDDTKAGLGDAVARELGALLVEAPTDVRINPLKLPDRRKLRDKLAGRSIGASNPAFAAMVLGWKNAHALKTCLNGRAGLFEFKTKDRSLPRCYVMLGPVCKLLTFAQELVANHW